MPKVSLIHYSQNQVSKEHLIDLHPTIQKNDFLIFRVPGVDPCIVALGAVAPSGSGKNPNGLWARRTMPPLIVKHHTPTPSPTPHRNSQISLLQLTITRPHQMKIPGPPSLPSMLMHSQSLLLYTRCPEARREVIGNFNSFLNSQ